VPRRLGSARRVLAHAWPPVWLLGMWKALCAGRSAFAAVTPLHPILDELLAHAWTVICVIDSWNALLAASAYDWFCLSPNASIE
jgi:uncharacterized membrane protein YadS